jgi:hypothetical protein
VQHLRWDKHGRTFSHQDEGKPNQFTYTSQTGQRTVDTGGGVYAPYVWDSINKKISYANHSCQFYDWYQVIRDENQNVLIDDQRFEIQYQNKKGAWRVLDLYQTEVTADQQDDHCTVTRRLWDTEGNELKIAFLFQPSYKIKLTFNLTVVTAGTYRIRFQNTGITGALTQQITGTNLTGILFDAVHFLWAKTESPTRSYTSEDQAQGKKINIYLGSYTLTDGQTITISPDVFSTSPNASGNDAGRDGTENTWSTSRDVMQWGTYGGVNGRNALRFTNVTIDAGSTVSAASITGIAEQAKGNAAYWRVYGIEGDTATTDLDTEAHLNAKTRTTAYADYGPINTSAWVGGNTYTLLADSASFRSVVQEILDTSWSSGYDMLFDIPGNDPNPSSNWTNVACLFTYDYEGYDFTLSITYTAGGGASIPRSNPFSRPFRQSLGRGGF